MERADGLQSISRGRSRIPRNLGQCRAPAVLIELNHCR
jgi:hypothetical protein